MLVFTDSLGGCWGCSNCTLRTVTRAAILAVTALLAVCGAASAQTFRVVVVPGFELSELARSRTAARR